MPGIPLPSCFHAIQYMYAMEVEGWEYLFASNVILLPPPSFAVPVVYVGYMNTRKKGILSRRGTDL